MTAAADLTVLALPPTASYCRRDAVWVPGDPGEGTLTLVCQGSRRAGARVWSDTYAVQEELDEPLPPGAARSFLLENLTAPDPHGPFRCTVGGMYESCGCEAGGWDRRRADAVGCKHRDSLRALILEGVL